MENNWNRAILAYAALFDSNLGKAATVAKVTLLHLVYVSGLPYIFGTDWLTTLNKTTPRKCAKQGAVF